MDFLEKLILRELKLYGERKKERARERERQRNTSDIPSCNIQFNE